MKSVRSLKVFVVWIALLHLVILLNKSQAHKKDKYSRKSGLIKDPPNLKVAIDLSDEKDDGLTLTLVNSEKYIVPPEEDEDPTDEQAADLDKKEDLEDLTKARVVVVEDDVDTSVDHGGNKSEKNHSDSPMETEGGETNDVKCCTNNLDRVPPENDNNPYISQNRIYSDFLGAILHSDKNNSHELSDFYSNWVNSKDGDNDDITDLPVKKETKLRTGLLREPMGHERVGFESPSMNQIIIIILVILSFLLVLLFTFCIVLIVKTKLINIARTGQSSKEFLMNNLAQDV